MKFQVVARSASATINWLRYYCLAKGRLMLRLHSRVKRWHDVCLDLDADLGEIYNVYEVCLPDDCQAHLTEWERNVDLEENTLYMFPRSVEYTPPEAITGECRGIIEKSIPPEQISRQFPCM